MCHRTLRWAANFSHALHDLLHESRSAVLQLVRTTATNVGMRQRSETTSNASAPPRRYQMNKMTDPASRAPIATLKRRKARSDRRTRCMTAPKASQGKQLGRQARKNKSPRAADCPSGLPAPSCKKVAAALAHTSHDFGLTH